MNVGGKVSHMSLCNNQGFGRESSGPGSTELLAFLNRTKSKYTRKKERQVNESFHTVPL